MLPRSRFGTSVSGRALLCLGPRAITLPHRLLSLAVKAVGEFIDENGRPPLSGFLPDMTAATSIFVQLQGAYKARANADAAVLRQRTNDLLLEAGLSSAAVSDGQFRTWCKSSQFVDVIQFVLRLCCVPWSSPTAPLHRFRSVQDELEAPCPALSSLQESLASGSEPEHLPLKWYIMLRAADTFHASTGRWPGVDDDKVRQMHTAMSHSWCSVVVCSSPTVPHFAAGGRCPVACCCCQGRVRCHWPV